MKKITQFLKDNYDGVCIAIGIASIVIAILAKISILLLAGLLIAIIPLLFVD